MSNLSLKLNKADLHLSSANRSLALSLRFAELEKFAHAVHQTVLNGVLRLAQVGIHFIGHRPGRKLSHLEWIRHQHLRNSHWSVRLVSVSSTNGLLDHVLLLYEMGPLCVVVADEGVDAGVLGNIQSRRRLVALQVSNFMKIFWCQVQEK